MLAFWMTYLIYFNSNDLIQYFFFFFFSSGRRRTRSYGDWSSDVCSSDLEKNPANVLSNGSRIRNQIVETDTERTWAGNENGRRVLRCSAGGSTDGGEGVGVSQYDRAAEQRAACCIQRFGHKCLGASSDMHRGVRVEGSGGRMAVKQPHVHKIIP